jgi:hypothetical protein
MYAGTPQAQAAFHPRRVQEFFVVCCPGNGLSSYAGLHLDTLSKILNHILYFTAVLDVCLFLSSWSVSFLPQVGFATTFGSLMICVQTAVVWIIVNNHRISAFSFLAANDFNLGLALGLTIGATIVAFSTWSSFRILPSCATHAVRHLRSSAHNSSLTSEDFEFACGQKRGSMTAVWFWSGLVFWFKVVTSMLLAIGRNELTLAGQYENISMNDYEDHFERFQRLSQDAGKLTSDLFAGVPSDASQCLYYCVLLCTQAWFMLPSCRGEALVAQTVFLVKTAGVTWVFRMSLFLSATMPRYRKYVTMML